MKLRVILAALAATLTMTGIAGPATANDHPRPIVRGTVPATASRFVVPDWGRNDVPPMATATAIGWRKVVVRHLCHKTVTRVWVRHGKGRWELKAKRVHMRRHHRRCACGRA